MKRYFKHWAESEHGVGTVYIEFEDGWPSRQVAVYGSVYEVGDKSRLKFLADQPLENLGLVDEDEVDAEVFDSVWRRAEEQSR